MLFRFLLVASLFLYGCSKPHEKVHSLRLNLYSEPPTLDLRKAIDSTSINVLYNLFEGLTRIGLDHKPHPAVAERIEISDDQLNYTFHLRECHWSNGDPVTSKDFLRAWTTTLDPQFPSTYAYKHYLIKNGAAIKAGSLPMETLGVQAPDDRTLIVTLECPAPYFLELLSWPSFGPINRSIDERSDNWFEEAGPLFVSNGPYRLKKWVHDSELILEKNPFYWERDAISLDKVHFTMIDDTMTEFYMFEMGELDWAGSPLSNLPSEIVPSLKENGKLFSYATAGVYCYKINTDKPLGKNLKIRQALGLAINRRILVDHILQANQIPATGLVPALPNWKGARSYFPDGDLNKAQQLFQEGLDELGLTREKLEPVKLTFNCNREHQKIAQAIQQQWREGLGFRVKLETFDWKAYLSKIDKQDYEIARISWVADYSDPLAFLEAYKFRDHPGDGGNNCTGWEHPKYISLLDAAERELNGEQRALLLAQAEELLMSEMPIIPLYYIIYSYMKKPYVQDVHLSPLGMMDLKWAKIE